MASVFAHALVATTIGSAFKKTLRSPKFWLLSIFCATIPDADIITFRFGIRYEDMLGHRGWTHSILFAFLLAIFIGYLFHYKSDRKTRALLTLNYFLCTISHGMLDAMTTGGRGIGFFIPFSAERFFFPWKVIQVSPMSASRFFSEWGIAVLKSEAYWVGIPCVIVLSIIYLLRRLK